MLFKSLLQSNQDELVCSENARSYLIVAHDVVLC
jgi:hypothetical protein